MGIFYAFSVRFLRIVVLDIRNHSLVITLARSLKVDDNFQMILFILVLLVDLL